MRKKIPFKSLKLPALVLAVLFFLAILTGCLGPRPDAAPGPEPEPGAEQTQPGEPEAGDFPGSPAGGLDEQESEDTAESPGSQAGKAVITPEGAVVISGKEPMRFRAYRPEVSFNLAWEGPVVPVELTLDNVAADHVTVSVTPEKGGEAASCHVRKLSPTQVVLAVSGGRGNQVVTVKTKAPAGHELCVALVGDNQGRNETLAKIIEEVNASDALFLIHLGDMIPSGGESEYRDFLKTMSGLRIPFYTVAGNHDTRGNGASYYKAFLAPLRYAFDYFGYRFIFADTSGLSMNSEQLAWLKDMASAAPKTLVFTHVPAKDPRGQGHAFLNEEDAKAFTDLVRQFNVRGVFTGHVHMFHERRENDTLYVTSGGGGAILYAPKNEGGYHHWTLLKIGEAGLSVEARPVEAPHRENSIVVTGPAGDVEVTAERLREMATVRKQGGFQNRLNNYVAVGEYLGVPVRDLLDLAGGMREEDTLVVYSMDGYFQEYGYANVYPEKFGWQELQGDMVLAIAYEGQTIPEWQDGYRIAFLPDDGMYDNEDCAKTSLEGQGWNVYESAGGRWSKFVVRLEVRRP